jgi:ubiquinone/menaquinone biosynthesis C-methylase UbiE
MRSNTSTRVAGFVSGWASGEWRSAVKPDPRAEWERHFNLVGLSLLQFAGQEVLEVGCGATGVVYYLPEAKRRVGIDPAASGMRKWNTEADGRSPIELLELSAESVPFPDASFDTVFCINCLDHSDDPEAILAEIWRVLRPGGCFMIHFDITAVQIGGLTERWKAKGGGR